MVETYKPTRYTDMRDAVAAELAADERAVFRGMSYFDQNQFIEFTGDERTDDTFDLQASLDKFRDWLRTGEE